MIEREDIPTAIVAAAPDGELISRVRLQKTAYLLEQLGFKAGLLFEYHHYGPYSRELDNATADARAFKKIEEIIDRRSSDGAPFSRFRLIDQVHPNPQVYRAMARTRVAELVSKFSQTNVTVLELAATVHWLAFQEKVGDWRFEIHKRKGQKVQGGRLERAIDLLAELDLSPPQAAVA